LIGAVFLLPFVFFPLGAVIEPASKRGMWTLFGAGAALGAVGCGWFVGARRRVTCRNTAWRFI